MNLPSHLFQDKRIWKGKELTTTKDDSLKTLFSKGSVHQIFSDIFQHETKQPHPLAFHIPSALALTIAKEQLSSEDLKKKVFVFIGRDCFPSIFFLRDCFQISNPSSFANFLFLNTSDEKIKLWALEVALSSTSVAFVMTSIDRLSFTTSRRLSLLAEKNGALCFLFPSKDTSSFPSAVRARWKLMPQLSNTPASRWSLSLQHIKGTKTKRTVWNIGIAHEKEISINLFPTLVNQSDTIETLRRAGA